MNRKKFKYFVFSDIHGDIEALERGLQKAGYDYNNPEHILVSLGDAFDRGENSQLIYTKYLSNKDRCISIKGNHDVMFQEYLEKGMDGEFVLFNILHNGLLSTIESFAETYIGDYIDIKLLEDIRQRILRRYPNLLYFLKNMPLYYETEHCIFSHAGINPDLKNWKDTTEDFFLWDIENSYKNCPHTRKIVFIGHHHAFRVKRQAKDYDIKYKEDLSNHKYGNMIDNRFYKIGFFGNNDKYGPYVFDNKIAIDGCVGITHCANVVVIDDYPIEIEEVNQENNEETVNNYTYTFTYGNPGSFGIDRNIGNYTVNIDEFMG